MAESSHITNRNRGHRSRCRSYRPPIIKAEARLCPSCEKPTSLGALRCRQCGSPISVFGTNQTVAPEQSLFIQVADGKRVFLANCIDGLLTALVATGIIFMLSGENHTLIRGAHKLDSALLWLASQLGHITITALACFTALIVYQCSAAALSGYTPGRRVAGIVLVHKKGRELTRTRLIVRSLFSLISWGLLGAGYFLPLLDRYHRTLHDICAQTILVQRKLQIP